MKHLLSILLICSIGFTQELTVEGDLNVTGNIQNQTIDSLLQVIADLQSQVAALQLQISEIINKPTIIAQHAGTSDSLIIDIESNTVKNIIEIQFIFAHGQGYNNGLSCQLYIDNESIQDKTLHYTSSSSYYRWGTMSSSSSFLYEPTFEQIENGFEIKLNVSMFENGSPCDGCVGGIGDIIVYNYNSASQGNNE